jgi:hypothetical protein
VKRGNLTSPVTSPCRQDHWEQNGCGRIMYSRIMGRIRMGQRVRRCTHRSQVGYRDLPAGRQGRAAHGDSASESHSGARRPRRSCHLERSQPARLSRATDGRGDGGSSRACRRLTRQPGTRPTSPTSPTPDVAAKSPRDATNGRRVRWSESRAILPYGRNHKATKWRGGSEPPLAALSPLGERLPHWGTVRADAPRPC